MHSPTVPLMLSHHPYIIKLKRQFCDRGYRTLLQALLASLSVTSMLGAVGNWTHLNFQ